MDHYPTRREKESLQNLLFEMIFQEDNKITRILRHYVWLFGAFISEMMQRIQVNEDVYRRFSGAFNTLNPKLV
jgi:hypothetical protein